MPGAVRRWFAEVQPTNLCMNSVSKAHYPEHVSSPSTLNIIYPEPFAFLFSPITVYLRIYSLPAEIVHTGICSDLRKALAMFAVVRSDPSLLGVQQCASGTLFVQINFIVNFFYLECRVAHTEHYALNIVRVKGDRIL